MKNINPKYYWTKEKCHEESLKCKTRTEFQKKYAAAYIKARKNKWLDEICNHMENKIKPNGYWTLKKCKEEALKYESKNEWIKKSNSSYVIAHRNKWLDECSKHMVQKGSLYGRFIYVVEFSDNSVYIGLTCNPKERFNDHKNEKESTVYKYIIKTGLEPIFKLITKDFLPPQEASNKEIEIIEKYRSEGWNILNVVNGGGLGAGIRKWTYEKCLEEGLKYNTRGELKLMSASCYRAILRYGWDKECLKHMIIHKNNRNRMK